jgi:hypothetical protein
VYVPYANITANDPQFGNQDITGASLGPLFGLEDTSYGSVPAALPPRPVLSNLVFRFHPGGEDQEPDPEIVAALGDLAPAYRHLMTLMIVGLIVGQGGSVDADYTPFGGSPDLGDQFSQGVVPEKWPLIEVELADGQSFTVNDHDFTMVPTAQPFTTDVTLVADWDKRQVAVVQPFSASGNSMLDIYDMDTRTQTQAVAITGNAGEAVGPTYGFCVWDRVNNVFYTERAGDHCLCSVNGTTGAVISTALLHHFGLGPDNPGHTTITDAAPADTFPRPGRGDIDYVVNNGALWPVILAGATWCAAHTPTADGTLNAFLRPASYYAATSGITSIKAFPLASRAVNIEHNQFQDVAFVVACKENVQIVYVTVQTITPGGFRTAKILGRKTVYTSIYGVPGLVATLDADGNIIVQECAVGFDTLLTKIPVTFTTVADLIAAPGWQGTFPQDGTPDPALFRVAQPLVSTWLGTDLTASDLSYNTYCGGKYLVDFKDLSVTTITGFDNASFTTVWDSQYQTRYYHNTVTGFGNGLKSLQAFNGISGELGQLDNYLKLLANEGGFPNAVLSVDPTLTDQIPGIIINKPYSLTVLFNDIGSLYDFTYFNSGGTLKFTKSTNNPLRASGGWTITGAPVAGVTVTIQDGDTATIGTQVYRFKLVPNTPYDVKICTDTITTIATGLYNALDAMQKTAQNFLAALHGDLSICAADSLTDGFFPGTLPNTKVTAKMAVAGKTIMGPVTISLLAQKTGAAGNSIVTTCTGTHMSFTHATLTGGAEIPIPTVNLTKANLAFVQENSVSENDALITMIEPFGQGQRAAALTYFALEQDYQLSSQTYIPDNFDGGLGVTGATTVTYNIPFIISTSEAYARIVKVAIKDADNVIMQNFRLPQSFMLLEPTDIITVTLGQFAYTIRLDECTFNGDWSTSFSAANYLFRSDVDVASSDSAANLPQDVPGSSDAYPVVIDAPILNPRSGSVPSTAALQEGVRSFTTSFTQANVLGSRLTAGNPAPMVDLFNTTHDIKYGNVAGVMPTATEPFYATSETSITITSKTITASDLASATYIDFVAGKNCLAIGSPGNWEYIYFRDVLQLSTLSFKLTGLIRAQRGTDAFITHGSNEIVCLINSVATNFVAGNRPAALPSSEVGNTWRYIGRGFPTRRQLAVDVPVNAYSLYPFSPCRLKAHPSGVSNDLTVSWTRRDRLNYNFVSLGAPLSETTELYDLEILSGSTVVRTVNGLVTPTYNYTTAQQTTDGFSPPLATLKFRVYQRGELGRGFPRLETVDVA